MNQVRLFKSMTPSGGTFLAGIGAGLTGFALIPPPSSYIFLLVAVIAGFASGVIVAILSRFVFHLPKPSGMELKLVWIPVVAEFAILFLLSRFVPMDERTMWIVVLAVVGLHFLPMVWSYGPLIVMLGGACFGVAVAGWLVPAIPLNWIIGIDGTLKLVFGLVMLSGLFRGQARPAAA